MFLSGQKFIIVPGPLWMASSFFWLPVSIHTLLPKGIGSSFGVTLCLVMHLMDCALAFLQILCKEGCPSSVCGFPLGIVMVS